MRKLGENIIYSFLNTFSINILGAVFWFILSFFLNVSDFGIISYINSLSVFLTSLFSFGIFSALWKYCSENKLAKVFFISFLFSSLISNFLTVIFISFFIQPLGSQLFLITSIFVIFLIFSSYFENILYGFQEFKKIFVSNFLSLLLRIFIVLFFYLFFKLNVINSLVSIIISTLIGSLFKLLFALGHLTFKFSIRIDLSEVKRFFSFGLSSFLSTFSSVFFPNFLVIFSFLFVSSIFAGVIYFSQLVYSVISFLPSILIGASLPLISNLLIKRKLKKSVEITKNLFKISLIIIISLTFLVGFYLKDILDFLGMQKEFVYNSPQIFLFVSFSASFFLFSNILFSFLFSLNKIKEIYYVEIFCIALFLIILFFVDISYFLISYFIISIVRFFSYLACFSKILNKFFTVYESIKIIIFIFISFLIPFVFSKFKIFSNIINLVLSFFLILILSKILRIIDEKDKKFIKSLKLNSIIEEIILKLT